jgi:formate hydrogenlyase transcriptional activator
MEIGTELHRIHRVGSFEEIIGSSNALRSTLADVERVAPTDSTVLILGETGTGKELLAHAVHMRSNRSKSAFVCVNCAAVPPSLIAAELFGHEKGAFTDALQRRLGRFEAANGGTIFLDEVGELLPETQIGLLRVLQEREIERLGSSQSIAVDVRVLAATNRDLRAAVAAGAFRSDLYYRLNVFPIHTPPLRERTEDIPQLVEHFIHYYARRTGKTILEIKEGTLHLLRAHDWPGNIRELQNVVERGVVLCEEGVFSVEESWLKRRARTPSMLPSSLPYAIAICEKELIEAALLECRGRISGLAGAAVKLGIPRQTLQSKIATLHIDKYQYKALAGPSAPSFVSRNLSISPNQTTSSRTSPGP